MKPIRLDPATETALIRRLGTAVADPPPRKTRVPQVDYVAGLQTQLRALRLPLGTREHRFHETRSWRFDLAWPDEHIALEVEGGVWKNGRHTRGRGFSEDCKKYAEAVVRGWRLLRCTPSMIQSGEAVRYVAALLGRPLSEAPRGTTKHPARR